MSTIENSLAPLHVFNFDVDFYVDPLDSSESGGTDVAMCSGSFSECTGLEATMEPKVIKEGGRNYGAAQRAGQVTFATVILKRGMTSTGDLWNWFEMVSGGAYAHRLSAYIHMRDAAHRTVLTWKLINALPTKFKSADLNAKGTEIGVEELHLVHEGITMLYRG